MQVYVQRAGSDLACNVHEFVCVCVCVCVCVYVRDEYGVQAIYITMQVCSSRCTCYVITV